MKDHRFIELLNLYIDRQISVAETAELEAEIQQEPRRQAVYRQYCQIHSATKQVYQSFRASADEQPVLPAGQAGAVEMFESKRRRSYFAYYAGGLAAACLALVFHRSNSAPERDGDLAQSEIRSFTAASYPVVPAVPGVGKSENATSGPVNLRNSSTNPDYTAMLAAMREQDEERAVASGNFQLNPPVRSLFTDGMFTPVRVAPAQELRPFRLQQTPLQVEQTAFQFQR